LRIEARLGQGLADEALDHDRIGTAARKPREPLPSSVDRMNHFGFGRAMLDLPRRPASRA